MQKSKSNYVSPGIDINQQYKNQFTMQLFKKLFSPFTRMEQDNFSGEQLTVVTDKKSVSDMFQLNINNLPLDTFCEEKVEIDRDGVIIQNYYKVLDYKECGVFDTVQVKIAGNKSIHVIFRASEPNLVNKRKLKKIIDSLCAIYGQGISYAELYPGKISADADKQFYVSFACNHMNYPVVEEQSPWDRFMAVWGITQLDVSRPTHADLKVS